MSVEKRANIVTMPEVVWMSSNISRSMHYYPWLVQPHQTMPHVGSMSNFPAPARNDAPLNRPWPITFCKPWEYKLTTYLNDVQHTFITQAKVLTTLISHIY